MRTVLLILFNPITAYLAVNGHISHACTEDVTNALVIIGSTMIFVVTIVIDFLHKKAGHKSTLATLKDKIFKPAPTQDPPAQ